MLTYQLSHKAEEDIFECYQYGISRYGLIKASEYIQGLQQQYVELCENPFMGKRVRDVVPGLRKIPYISHVSFYLPRPSKLLIVRVLGKEMDFERLFAAND